MLDLLRPAQARVVAVARRGSRLATGVDLAGLRAQVRPDVVELVFAGGERPTVGDQLTLLRTVRSALASPTVDGVVVRYPREFVDETAYVMDVFHTDRRPVVLVADDAGLAEAARAAIWVRGRGVLVVADGKLYAARSAFADCRAGELARPVLGWVGMFDVTLTAPATPRGATLPVPNWTAARPHIAVIDQRRGPGRFIASADADGVIVAGDTELLHSVLRTARRSALVAWLTSEESGSTRLLPALRGLPTDSVVLVRRRCLPQLRPAMLAALLSSPDPAARPQVLRSLLGRDS